MSIVVDAINSAPFWTLAHVFKKVRERLPAFAHLDTPSAVVVEVRLTRLLAAVAHSSPRMPSWARLPAPCVPMNYRCVRGMPDICFAGSLSLVAPAGFRPPLSNVISTGYGGAAAYAKATPSRRANVLDSSKSIEGFVKQIKRLCHG